MFCFLITEHELLQLRILSFKCHAIHVPNSDNNNDDDDDDDVGADIHNKGVAKVITIRITVMLSSRL